jgi:SAM domain (Sterile alpha motif)
MKDNKRKRKVTTSELPQQGTTSATATTSRFNPATATEQQVTQPSLVPLPPIDSAQNPKLWTVEYVASWLRSKGFNQGICDKFTCASSSCSSNILKLHMRRTVNEIDGEVLFGLNDKNLKSDIGIEAYGPRLKIMNAINDLFPGGECEYQVASTVADFFHSLPLTYHSQYLASLRCHLHLAFVANAASLVFSWPPQSRLFSYSSRTNACW